MPESREEKNRKIRFILCFVCCFLLLSLLEMGTYHIWSSLKNPAPSGSAAVLSARSEFHGEKGCLEVTTPFGNLGSKSGLVIFILAMLLNAAISEYAAARLTRPHSEKEEIQEILRRHVKS